MRKQGAGLGRVVVWLGTSKSGFKMKIVLKLKLPWSIKVFENCLNGPKIQGPENDEILKSYYVSTPFWVTL